MGGVVYCHVNFFDDECALAHKIIDVHDFNVTLKYRRVTENETNTFILSVNSHGELELDEDCYYSCGDGLHATASHAVAVGFADCLSAMLPICSDATKWEMILA